MPRKTLSGLQKTVRVLALIVLGLFTVGALLFLSLLIAVAVFCGISGPNNEIVPYIIGTGLFLFLMVYLIRVVGRSLRQA